MARSCWYDNLDVGKQERSSGFVGSRQRSKSTSSESVEFEHRRYWKTNKSGSNKQLSENVDSCDHNGFSNNNIHNSVGNYDSHGPEPLFSRGRELLIGERIRTRTISGGHHHKQSRQNKEENGRLVELLNVIFLTCVFVLGAVSAVFVIVCYKNGDFAMGPFRGEGRRRVELFQPFPQADQLAVIDDPNFEPILPPFDDFKEDNECEGENKLALELEAITSVRSALEKKEEGKHLKAQKLFQHAMALCPRHPDVLTHYGEFFEETRQDYMMADHLYVQALAYSPRHTQALINRKRTLPVVEELDEKRLKRIDAKRDQLLQLSETNRALRRIRKEAYFQHIYHSAGIEGNTMSLSQTRQIVETRMAVGGKSIIEHNEILGLDAAMRFVNSSLINRIGRVTLQDILLIHKHVMGFVDPEEAGQLRKTRVYVGNHVPPPPEEVLDQMMEFVEWLNSETTLTLHPVQLAAIAHYKFVYIHPFLDGNGRTARLLMNFLLMTSEKQYPPVIIRKQDRMFYYEHLSTANKGDLRPFIRFIGDCTEKTMDVYIWATQERYVLELEDNHLDNEKDV